MVGELIFLIGWPKIGFQDDAFFPHKLVLHPHFLKLWFLWPQYCDRSVNCGWAYALCRTFCSKILHGSQLLLAPINLKVEF